MKEILRKKFYKTKEKPMSTHAGRTDPDIECNFKILRLEVTPCKKAHKEVYWNRRERGREGSETGHWGQKGWKKERGSKKEKRKRDRMWARSTF